MRLAQTLQSRRHQLGISGRRQRFLKRIMGAGPDVAREWISSPNVGKKVSAALGEHELDRAAHAGSDQKANLRA